MIVILFLVFWYCGSCFCVHLLILFYFILFYFILCDFILFRFLFFLFSLYFFIIYLLFFSEEHLKMLVDMANDYFVKNENKIDFFLKEVEKFAKTQE